MLDNSNDDSIAATDTASMTRRNSTSTKEAPAAYEALAAAHLPERETSGRGQAFNSGKSSIHVRRITSKDSKPLPYKGPDPLSISLSVSRARLFDWPNLHEDPNLSSSYLFQLVSPQCREEGSNFASARSVARRTLPILPERANCGHDRIVWGESQKKSRNQPVDQRIKLPLHSQTPNNTSNRTRIRHARDLNGNAKEHLQQNGMSHVFGSRNFASAASQQKHPSRQRCCSLRTCSNRGSEQLQSPLKATSALKNRQSKLRSAIRKKCSPEEAMRRRHETKLRNRVSATRANEKRKELIESLKKEKSRLEIEKVQALESAQRFEEEKKRLEQENSRLRAALEVKKEGKGDQ